MPVSPSLKNSWAPAQGRTNETTAVSSQLGFELRHQHQGCILRSLYMGILASFPVLDGYIKAIELRY